MFATPSLTSPFMEHFTRWASGVVAVLLGAAACGRQVLPPAAPAAAREPGCILRPTPARPSGTQTIGVTEPVDPGRAPIPSNDVERFVFRQLYEALVRVDCEGRVTPALATAWRSLDGGRSWTFTLRGGATFWDGTPITAADVLASWRPSDDGRSPLVTVGTVSAAAGSTFTVLLAAPSAELPRTFADPALAVVKRIRESPWPLGSGAYWVARSDSATITLRAVAPGSRPGDVVLRGPDTAAWRARDVDLVLARGRMLDDPGTAGFDELPVPWDRVYALHVPRRRSGNVAPQVREALVAVLWEGARPADVPGWWRAPAPLCARIAPRAGARSPGSVPSRIAYPANDQAAAALAERLAALTAAGSLAPVLDAPRGAVRAMALAPAALAAAAACGGELAYVFSLPRRTYAACPPVAVATDSLLALVETRPRVFARQAAAGLGLEWDGTLTLLHAR